MSALPKPGSIITLAVDVYDDNGNPLPAELDVVFLEVCGADDEIATAENSTLLVSAEDEDEQEVFARLHPGEWYQRPEESRS